MGRKLPADQIGVFPGHPNFNTRNGERDRIISRVLAERAGLPSPEKSPFTNLGNREVNAYKSKAQIQRAIRDNLISAIEGPTGSGKSTQVPQYALEMGYRVILLEPRRLTADNLGERLQSELSMQLGEDAAELVGIRHGERYENPGGILQVMTPGTFLRCVSEIEQFADEPVVIIPDEIHEKDFETEMAVAVGAMLLEKHPKWRLTLMSATMDAPRVDERLGQFSNGAIPHVHIEGRPYELKVREEPELTPVEAYKLIGKEHERTLMFTAGKAEVRSIIDGLQKLKDSSLIVRPLYSQLTRAEMNNAIHATLKPGQRLVVVSTPIAQTGITIEGVTLVIADGTVRRPHLDKDGVEGLFKAYAAQDELVQMGGRSGRDVGGGIAIIAKSSDPRFGFKAVDEREPQAPAQIYSTNIARNTLLAISLGYDFFKVNDYLINNVERKRILDALEVLWRLQAIDDHNNITDIGKAMSDLPVRPELSRCIVEANRSNASQDMLRQLAAIVSAVDAGGLPFYDSSASELWRKDIQARSNDDYLAELDMFRATRKHYHGEDDVNEHALSQRGYDVKNVRQAHQTYDKICQRLRIPYQKEKIQAPTAKDIDELHDYLMSGLFDFFHEKIRDERLRGKGANTRSWYREAFRTGTSERYISDRSHMPSRGPEYAVGLPRRFEKTSNGSVDVHNVIEYVMPSSIDKLTKHIMHLLAQRSTKPPRLIDGILKQPVGLYFGDIKVGEQIVVPQGIVHTPETRKVLFEGVLNKPTQTISELLTIKDTLEWLQRRVDKRVHSVVFPNGVLDQDWLNEVIAQATTDDVTSIYELDNKLRAVIVRDQVSLRTWISEEHERMIRDSSPDTITIANGVTYSLYWSHGRPLINGFNHQDAGYLPDRLKLDDGREVRINHYNVNGDTKPHTGAELKTALGV